MIELTPDSYAVAQDLFQALANHLLVPNLFTGQLEARLLVDDPITPRAGVIIYNDRLLFGGDPQIATFNLELQQFFAREIQQEKERGSEGFLACFAPTDWQRQLDEIFSGYELIHAPREYYIFENPNPSPEITPPPGFSFHLVDAAFLKSDLKGLEVLREEMCSERTSVEDFLAKSFGVCPVSGNEIAGWCLSEYNTGKRCEIGIATLEPFQRQGLATQTTKAFLAEAAKRGYTHIGWDCWKRNLASAATARKAGFTLVEEYPALVVLF